MELKAVNTHLTDAELFTLAVPPVGEPEALPRHLSECFRCSRALQEWKLAVREIADDDMAALDHRTAAEWESLENETIAAMRRAGQKRRAPVVQWAASIAAGLLLGVLLLPAIRNTVFGGSGGPGGEQPAQDQKDDALLRDVARPSQGDDGGSWSTLAPDPGAPGERREEELRERIRRRDASHSFSRSTPRRRPSAPLDSPEGKWWKNPRVTAELGLSAEQGTEIEKIFVHSRPKLIDLRGDLEKKQLDLQVAMEDKTADRSAVEKKIESVENARAALQKTRALMLLDMKQVLKPDQWERLVQKQQERRQLMQERRRNIQQDGMRPHPDRPNR